MIKELKGLLEFYQNTEDFYKDKVNAFNILKSVFLHVL